MIDDLYVRSPALDPPRDTREDALGMAGGIAHDHHGDYGFAVVVIVPDFGRRDIKRTMELCQERLEAAALLFERRAIRQVKFDGQRGHVHDQSLTTPGALGKRKEARMRSISRGTAADRGKRPFQIR